jgi:hypothetical protein
MGGDSAIALGPNHKSRLLFFRAFRRGEKPFVNIALPVGHTDH